MNIFQLRLQRNLLVTHSGEQISGWASPVWYIFIYIFSHIYIFILGSSLLEHVYRLLCWKHLYRTEPCDWSCLMENPLKSGRLCSGHVTSQTSNRRRAEKKRTGSGDSHTSPSLFHVTWRQQPHGDILDSDQQHLKNPDRQGSIKKSDKMLFVHRGGGTCHRERDSSTISPRFCLQKHKFPLIFFYIYD